MSLIETELESRYQQIVFRSPHSIWVSCLGILLLNALLFLPSRVWESDLSELGIHSQPQLVGMLLLFLLVPMWLFACFFVTQRHSLLLARQLDTDSDNQFRMSEALTQLPRKPLLIGLTGGLFYALAFNIPSNQIGPALEGDWNTLSIVLSQIVLWVCIGGLLAVRLDIARLFASVGNRIEFSLFEQTSLQPFARVGMLDIVIVFGGVAIATVQSLDAQFRLENYLSALLVAAPAAIALLIWPMWKLHTRMAARKDALLNEVNEKILACSEDTTDEAVSTLEALLQRRDRVKSLHTWPLDIHIWRRLAFYVLIPPLAWSGAALVEVVVNRILGL